MKHQVSFGWKPPKWLNKVDCCRNDVFLVASGTYFYGGEVGTCEFFKKTVSRNANISFELSFLSWLNQNRVPKFLISVLDKSVSIAFCSQVPLYSVRALFHPVWALFHTVGAIFHPGWTLFYLVRLFFIQAGPFYAEWGSFPNRKAPFPPMLGQATMSANYKPFGQSALPFKIKGPPFIQWFFVS